jgi:hypothetical protein
MTIATNGAFSPVGRKMVNSTYIVATANDTTASGNGPTISNLDGLLERIGFGVVCTNGTGTSPTVTATLKGSIDGTNWFNVLDSAGNAIATGAVTAAATNSEFEDTNQEGITKFPPYVRVSYAVGGSSTPGWTGSIQVDLQRAA